MGSWGVYGLFGGEFGGKYRGMGKGVSGGGGLGGCTGFGCTWRGWEHLGGFGKFNEKNLKKRIFR